jgi:hypothetical protein
VSPKRTPLHDRLRAYAWPWWLLWVFGYVVLVPIGLLVGSGGVPGDDSSSMTTGILAASSLAVGWTIIGLTKLRHLQDED